MPVLRFMPHLLVMDRFRQNRSPSSRETFCEAISWYPRDCFANPRKGVKW